jgi:hypothetical protein
VGQGWYCTVGKWVLASCMLIVVSGVGCQSCSAAAGSELLECEADVLQVLQSKFLCGGYNGGIWFVRQE